MLGRQPDRVGEHGGTPMTESEPARAIEIIAKTIMTHTTTYFVAGVLAYSLLDYPALISGTALGAVMRPLRDPLVVAGTLFQPIRGALFGIVFYVLRRAFFARPNGWLVMWAALVAFGIFGTFGSPPGSLEGFIYTTVPASVQLTLLPEVLVQSLALSWLLFRWVSHPESRWLRRSMIGAFVVALLLPLLGLAQVIGG